MSFVSDIFSAVADVGSQILGFGNSVGGGISGVVDSVGSEVANIAGEVTSSLNSSITSGLGTAFHSISDVVGGVSSLVSDVSKTLGDVVTPIVGLVNTVTAEVKQINDGFIQPLNSFVQGSVTAYNALNALLEKGISGGIAGIAAFSNTLSNTLSGFDATVSRALQQLGLSNADLAKNILIPAFGGIGSQGFASLIETYQNLSGTKFENVDAIKGVTLTNYAAPDQAVNLLDSWLAGLKNTTGFWGFVSNTLADLIKLAPLALIAIEPASEEFRQQLLQKTGVEILDVATAMKALTRGILTDAEAQDELSRHGLNQSRFDVLKELETWQPGISDTLQLLTRGAITDAVASQVLAKLGLTPDDITAVKEAYLTPIDPTTYIKGQSRQAAGVKGFLQASYTLPPPELFVSLYPPAGLSPERASLDWAAAFNTPNMDWWITAFYKGIRTRSEVELAASAENIPPEVIKDLIDVWGGTISAFMIPELLAVGAITQQQCADYASYAGMDAKSVPLIVAYGLAKAKAPAASAAAELKAISLKTAQTMFIDGIVTAPQYEQILAAHGVTGEAATLTVALTQHNLDMINNKENAQYIVNQVNLGLLDETTAVSQLYAMGLTDAQVANYVKTIKKTKQANAKLPDLSLTIKMFKKGLIQQDAALNNLVAIGYSANWAALIFQAETT